tara:strand:+ start:286 stop:825 length:540 start_codon:yes stop_codon:yes gene_type:complete
VDPTKFFGAPGNKKVVTIALADKDSCNRLNRLLHVVVSRLPDEKQFHISGGFMFSRIDNLEEIWEAFDSLVPQEWKTTISSSSFAPDPEILMKIQADGVCKWVFDAVPPFYVVSILADRVEQKSDDYVIGLIAYFISQMSYSWRALQSNETIQSVGDAEYKEEARRLGFAKEIQILDST